MTGEEVKSSLLEVTFKVISSVNYGFRALIDI